MRLSSTAVGLLVVQLAAAAPAAPQPRSEYQTKAAYLSAFGRFVEWPEGTPAGTGELAICVLGADPFGPALDAAVAGAEARGRRIVARRIGDLGGATRCHILFVAASEEPQLDTILAALRASGVLTVSDMPRFVGRGGMIQFVTTEGRVQFEIDLPSVRQSGLTVSSDLLRVASAVRQEPGPGREQ